jgi:RimJ/RimL family protein N-acetyltransferase
MSAANLSDFPAEWPRPERKEIQGRYVRLAPLDHGRHSAGLFVAITGDAAARLHLWLPEIPPASLGDVRDWAAAKAALADPLFFAVIDKATGRVEGRQSLMRIDTAHGVAEIGNILWGPRIAGTRIATEAQFLFADWVFGLGYRRYEWKCNDANEPSKKAALRFGFTFEGVFRQHMVVKGENRDTAWFSIIDKEWPRLRQGYLRWLDPENFDGVGRQKEKLEESISAISA